MRPFILFFFLLHLYLTAQSQQKEPAPFWKEDFSAGSFPEGWINQAVNDSSIRWECTNQPFPGSYGHDQQAPPLSSPSGGFHAQYASGKRVGKAYRKWEKAGIWPDCWLQTPAINCTGHSSVVLTFYQNFLWNDWGKLRSDSGLFVSVSPDGRTWREYDVRSGIGSEQSCPDPMKVELNISEIAANQPTVFIRFHWRGIFAWYWMVDDIALREAYFTDVASVSMISHKIAGNRFTAHETLKFAVVNLSSRKLDRPVTCNLQIDQRPLLRKTINLTANSPLGIVDTVVAIFPDIDLTDLGIHHIQFYTSLQDDERRINDTLTMALYSGAYKLGMGTGFEVGYQTVLISCSKAKISIEFIRDDIFRLRMAYDGNFTDPAGDYIVTNPPSEKVNLRHQRMHDYNLLSTGKMALRVYENPFRLALYKNDNQTLIWEEAEGLTYGKETTQYFHRGSDEYFYGGGMQNGRFSHRDKTIQLRIDWNWEEGGAPNPAPFYMSTRGYGVLRNTFAPGNYHFGDTVTLQHEEARFDAYYFTGNSLKEILNSYTDLTGKPFLPPRWALSLGDANCYNRGDNKGNNTTGYAGTTPDVINLIADKYIENDMPRGWILPNDGYGCGYTKLDSVVKELRKRGFRTGLWTENGVEKIAREVGVYGSRLCKLDVAWIGEGYRFGLDGCKAAYEGIEKNSDARGFIWSVCGWAGTHRNSVVWTGDQKGSWDYIRWHIPTVVGSGLSAQNCATGDVDGIFGGSAKTYTRDLQWKCFTPAFMSMSGWAPKDKQPYVYGEPYTSINRKYLQLKQRLTPYMYTLCHEATRNGVPAVRALVLEYPDDPVVKGTETQYQFLLGTDFLVAPVYEDTNIRNGIYLPEGTWYDYWTGKSFQGRQWLQHYPAPLENMPLFIRAGSLIPMNPSMNYDGEKQTDTITLDIWPGNNGQFEMIEDEGSNREYREGKIAVTPFSFKVDPIHPQQVKTITVGPCKGHYSGMPQKRSWIAKIHSADVPVSASVNGKQGTSTIINHKDAGYYEIHTTSFSVQEQIFIQLKTK